MLPNEEVELKQLVQSLRLPNDWDVLMIGDGAGCGWDSPSGWAVTVFDRQHNRKEVFSGGLSGNSTTCAELFPYLHAMIWHARVLAKAVRKESGRLPINVHIVTDVQSLAEAGNNFEQLLRDPKKLKLTRPFWAGLRQFVESGYRFTFYWSRRGTFETHREMNTLARKAMRAMRPKQESPNVSTPPPPS